MHLDLKPLSECRVLVVDDEEVSRITLLTLLGEHYTVEALVDGNQVIPYCERQKPDLILMDVNMPGVCGLDVCKTLKSREDLADIPVVFVTATFDLDAQNACWEAGATDFISKPVAASTLIHRTRNHLENKLHVDQLVKLTFRDSLTELYNRHYLNVEIESVIKQAVRSQEPIGVLMMDLDYFKAYNDHYGHQQGDQCLRQVAACITNTIRRPQDIAIRYGGEEFLVVLPFTNEEGVSCVAQQILDAVAQQNIAHEKSPLNRVSISIGGVCCTNAHEYSLFQLISIADKALYNAKHEGKNQSRISLV
ncbi:GGDEF domain-containing response regulator [Pseudoalteromonas pernae]|uniref:GGDEF domain-containing response regulator n=1 Tax=Pseudoalteromonas pernae TaxID=3118054 RepID=UPI003241C0B2